MPDYNKISRKKELKEWEFVSKESVVDPSRKWWERQRAVYLNGENKGVNT